VGMLRHGVAWCVALLSACGGRTVGESVGASSDEAGTDSGADDGAAWNSGADDGAAWSPVCPSSTPSVGSTCAPPGIECQYGSDPRADCNPVLRCGAGGVWQDGVPANQCPAPPNAADCPSTWESVPRGDSCPSNGTDCWYAEGTCVCRQEQADGGGLQTVWWCDDPSPSSCPVPYPRIGSACANETPVCTYKPCSFAVGCVSGVWQEAAAACGM
jgi:hypothetical protein